MDIQNYEPFTPSMNLNIPDQPGYNMSKEPPNSQRSMLKSTGVYNGGTVTNTGFIIVNINGQNYQINVTKI